MIVRPTELRDVPALNAILSEIVRIGGSTALETPLTDAEFKAYYVTGPDVVCCVMAEDDYGAPAGFQALERKAGEPDYVAYSSTFARATPKVRGIGTALFKATKDEAAAQGITEIIAKIRADNVSGLAYYTKMGFVDYTVDPAIPLNDGTLVDRVSKRFVL